MKDKKSEQVVLSFVAAINCRDAEGLNSLMSEDHIFVDAGGMTARGAREMRQA